MRISHPQIGLQRICDLFGISRQAHYKHEIKANQTVRTHQQVLDMVLQYRSDHPRIGGRKLYYLLQPQMNRLGIKLGRDAFFDLLASHNLLIKAKRRKTSTTYSRHWFRKYPNLIKGLPISAVNQVWVSDITYLRGENQFMYLSLITDAYSRKIVGYHLSDNLEAVNNLIALDMAIATSCTSLAGCIHHSDRGIQYCSHEYVDKLRANGIIISMTENGDPLENAIAERVNGILKQEYLNYLTFSNLLKARELVTEAVSLYNNKRPHLSCGMDTPGQVYENNHKPKAHWKNYWKSATVNHR